MISPLIALTATATPAVRGKSLEHGANSRIAKAFPALGDDQCVSNLYHQIAGVTMPCSAASIMARSACSLNSSSKAHANTVEQSITRSVFDADALRAVLTHLGSRPERYSFRTSA